MITVRRRYLHSELGATPLLQQGELDFSPAGKPLIFKPWALALGFLTPALKRTIRVKLFPLPAHQATAFPGSATLPFVISTEAKRSGEISVLPAFPGNVFRRKPPEKRISLAATMLMAAIIATAAWGQQPAPAPVPPGAVVLDHVVAVINGSVILESDVREEMNYAVLQPFSINSARNTPQRALQRLIDRALILQQMKTGGDTVAPPTPEELQEQIHQLRGLIPQCMEYHCATDAGWQAFLTARGLTEKEVEQHWAQRMLILSFIQSRFGSGVRITPAEIKDYYNKTLVPQLDEVKLPPLANVSSRIEEILLQQRVSSLLLEWLQSLKSEGSVSILDPAYGKVGTTGAGDDSDSGGQS
jgi:peptidyl-prolyl cis-trans isomerase SurA